MSLWIERAARKQQERALLSRTRQLLDVALAGTDSCEYLIALGPGGGLFLACQAGWTLDRFLAEHGGGTGWRVRRNERGVEVEGRADLAHCRLVHARRHVNQGPPRAGSARLLPAESD
ncbi:MAG: hypothetical protein RMI94_06365 [Bryobacterales bacterium]|nr:hypothetical protein [Bryobacteraceae bacterium]MDW8130154.1 hypothetical protein [Bryobacterales bacterium]